MWFIGVEVEQETSTPPPKKNPGSGPDRLNLESVISFYKTFPYIFCNVDTVELQKKYGKIKVFNELKKN